MLLPVPRQDGDTIPSFSHTEDGAGMALGSSSRVGDQLELARAYEMELQ
jgi:hypothetical protein